MGTNAHAAHTLPNPGPVAIKAGTKSLFIGMSVIGIVLFAAALKTDAPRAYASFVMNHFFFMSLALGGAFIAAVTYLTGAMWSAPVRRIGESFTAYLPFVLVTFAVLAIGIHHTYEWSHPEHVAGDLVLEHKSGYLNSKFFIIRNVIAILIWLGLVAKMIGNSLKQDQTKTATETLANRKLSPLFIVLFAITFTMAAFDQLMSLDPHWFSTMFGVYCFAGLFYSTLALVAVVTVSLSKSGPLKGVINENHLHDLGKFMFAFTIFWMYIAFSQFMLIWYANLPEETMYFMHRMEGGWMAVTIFLLVGKFMVPFFALLPRDAKRSPSRLFKVGVFMLIAQWIDMMWIVQPEFFKDGPRVSWIEIGTTIAFIGLFGTLVSRFMAKHNILAVGDPKLAEALFHHHQ